MKKLLFLLLFSVLPVQSVQATTLRWAAQNDILTFDPHSQNHTTTITLVMHIYVDGVKEVRKIDDHTVDFLLAGPDPVLLRKLTDFRIMSKVWSEKNRAQNVQDAKSKEETYSSRNANGTGAYILKGWEPDKRLVLAANPNWWDKREGNVTDVVYTPIKSDATRVSALLAGDVDLVTDLP